MIASHKIDFGSTHESRCRCHQNMITFTIYEKLQLMSNTVRLRTSMNNPQHIGWFMWGYWPWRKTLSTLLCYPRYSCTHVNTQSLFDRQGCTGCKQNSSNFKRQQTSTTPWMVMCVSLSIFRWLMCVFRYAPTKAR